MSDTSVNGQAEAAVSVAEVPAVEDKTAKMTDADNAESDEKAQVAKAAVLLKTTAKIDRTDYKNNRKYDPSTQPVTDDPDKIRAQVEFYFNDSNLPADKFMWEQTGGVENKPVLIKTICAFKRMRNFQPYSAVVAALKDSRSLEVSGEEGEELVRRKKAYVISTEAQKARLAASIYVKGFGDEESSTQFDLEAFFNKFGDINIVKLRRTQENLFKGSVFVEFASEEGANKFLALSPTPTWKGHELIIKKKIDYLEEKNRLIKAGELEPSNSRRPTFFEGKERGGGRGRGRGGRGGERSSNGKNDSNDWKKRRDDDQKNGFKGGRGGRGGRGRGRGGRGRGGRDNDRRGAAAPRSTNDVKAPMIQSSNNVKAPAIQATNDNGAPVKNGESNGKRALEDAGGEPPAKKVDVKA
ncbi:hypothetical protein B0H67DRAFT_250815 [Lasiosphaeris hirsuta]|uniref:Uncharacterized protein n=1 Tax=Lasiosphaeris hirsuta TaxID=260670 RepID=A0AA40AH77_9PEZI|nr:hypothetical protein B0H67DRAFT_250815 [Lasiosphaeris hirsuta]